MAKKPPEPKTSPKPDPGPLCGTCGAPKKNHTIDQLADCLASKN